MNSEFVRSKYRLQSVAARILSADKTHQWCVCNCMKTPIAGAVTVLKSATSAHFSGLRMCASVWTCPICSVKIMARRNEEIGCILSKSTSKKVLITYTIQHNVTDKLETLVSDLKGAIAYIRNGKRKRRLEENYGIEGFIRSVEIRYGRNGWHPHVHEILLCAKSADVCSLRADLETAYTRFLQGLGYSTVDGVTVDVRELDNDENGTDGAKYLTKQSISQELTNGEGKISSSFSLSPFQLLASFHATGDAVYRDLFVEYAKATYRKNQITYSHGLRALYAIEEKDDKTIAEEETASAQPICIISRENWLKVLLFSLQAEILIEACERSHSLIEWLAGHGIEATSPPCHADALGLPSVGIMGDLCY